MLLLVVKKRAIAANSLENLPRTTADPWAPVPPMTRAVVREGDMLLDI